MSQSVPLPNLDLELYQTVCPPRDTIRVPLISEPPETTSADPYHVTPAYYMQGMVRGQQAYLITNLLGGVSETLLQPQMVWTIGRCQDAGLYFADEALSRRHALIQYVRREGFYLVDLNSLNGTFVNGVQIKQRHLLVDGDRVQMANVVFTFFSTCRHRTLPSVHPEILAYA